MKQKIQKLLVLHSATASLISEVVAWAEYDGAALFKDVVGQDDRPPYRSVLEAMYDGWRVLQIDAPQRGREDDGGPMNLGYRVVLEKFTEVERGGIQ